MEGASFLAGGYSLKAFQSVCTAYGQTLQMPKHARRTSGQHKLWCKLDSVCAGVRSHQARECGGGVPDAAGQVANSGGVHQGAAHQQPLQQR